jgi:hypothetical protein
LGFQKKNATGSPQPAVLDRDFSPHPKMKSPPFTPGRVSLPNKNRTIRSCSVMG